ncbi:4-hydroxy-tetrahydrodipicolinate synthase [Amaricoccus solimangrovi]|uniref:4-hydroxy-tetrahydrodipicolinate synthase n=1 Tax=Amaricoccus solimangrovi TaxID=2589815 RepID=A0A501WMI5_9RHOB|nr:4-hydroxy-tetrahydrodipicolinate synthase [Amaricoccus solimangrovi]TPE49404.1 4-hydroxy-tetrahydrodipicolinate synthase [Amaricoccus solimangrovi]
MQFRGSIPALITPFRDGAVDEKALVDLVNWHVDEGTHGLVAVGTTGETPTLTHEEHEHVIELCVRTAAGRIPVIAGAGSNNTEESVSLMRFAKKVGADAALVVTPYYNKPSQRGLYHHFRTLHDAVELPIIIYNIPGRSVVDMTPATMGELAKLPRIVGVKDATGDITRVSDTRITCGKDFIQLSGEDASALGFNAHGGVGCISVVANIAPRLCVEFQQAMLDGNFRAALEYQDRLMPLHRAAFAEPNPCPTKYALSLLGKCTDEVRSPMVPLEEPTKERMRAAMRHAGLID